MHTSHFSQLVSCHNFFLNPAIKQSQNNHILVLHELKKRNCKAKQVLGHKNTLMIWSKSGIAEINTLVLSKMGSEWSHKKAISK